MLSKIYFLLVIPTVVFLLLCVLENSNLNLSFFTIKVFWRTSDNIWWEIVWDTIYDKNCQIQLKVEKKMTRKN